MAGAGKRKTTMAKLARERRLHERRLDKQARKEARKRAAEHPPSEETSGDLDELGDSDAAQPDLEPVAPQSLPRD
jgi:hypothetical protein